MLAQHDRLANGMSYAEASRLVLLPHGLDSRDRVIESLERLGRLAVLADDHLCGLALHGRRHSFRESTSLIAAFSLKSKRGLPGSRFLVARVRSEPGAARRRPRALARVDPGRHRSRRLRARRARDPPRWQTR